MTLSFWRKAFAPVLLGVLATGGASAADYPAPKHGEWVVKDFRFHTGQTLPELKLAYSTVGDPTGEPVLVLHGTNGSAESLSLIHI